MVELGPEDLWKCPAMEELACTAMWPNGVILLIQFDMMNLAFSVSFGSDQIE